MDLYLQFITTLRLFLNKSRKLLKKHKFKTFKHRNFNDRHGGNYLLLTVFKL
jgi:hypothetical protein